MRNEKYDLAVIANQPSRRVEDISNACNFTNSLLIEKPICETVQQYIDLKKLHQYKKIRSCIWTISCPFIYSQMVSDFFQYNEDPETIYCRWDEKLTNDRAYRLDKNVTSTAISHFLPLLSAYVEFNYESLLVDYKQKGHIRLVSKNSFKPNINIAWSRRNQTTEKKIFLKNRGSMAALNLMNQELKQIGIYKVSEKSLSPLQSQVHALLEHGFTQFSAEALMSWYKVNGYDIKHAYYSMQDKDIDYYSDKSLNHENFKVLNLLSKEADKEEFINLKNRASNSVVDVVIVAKKVSEVGSFSFPQQGFWSDAWKRFS